MQISDLAGWVRGLAEPSAAPLLASLGETLDSFAEIGLGYLSLDRSSGTLSGGEAQRVKMIRHLGSSLTDVTYVFDEPSTGLHPHDIQRMNDLLLRLRDKGNTVLVVEHKPWSAIAIADHVVDLGPGAGTGGRHGLLEGTVEGLRKSGTLTGRHLDDRAALKETVRTPIAALEIRGATAHNLRDVDVDIPLGVFVVVTGVAGSGKSSLVHGSIPAGAGVVAIDQGAIRGSRRSNPATYTGLLEPIRKAFAKANGVKPALFSANSEGACPDCNGTGVIYTDLGDDGRRRHHLRGVRGEAVPGIGAGLPPRRPRHQRGARDVGDRGQGVLGAGEARTPAAHAILDRLADVGLGYLSLGQRSPRCPGGERAAAQAGHPYGRRRAASTSSTSRPPGSTSLMSSSCSACSTGSSTPEKSVIVVEHHQAVMAHAGLDHRPRPRGWPRRRPDRLRGHTRRPRSPPGPPSPASTWRTTSAPDRGPRDS